MPIIANDDPRLIPTEGQRLEGKLIIIKADKINKRYRAARFQLYKATGGFGCNPGAMGKKIYADCIADGEEDIHWERYDVAGIANDDLVAECNADTSEAVRINPDDRCFMAVIAGQWATGKTVAEALAGVKKRKLGKGVCVWHVHPETRIHDLGGFYYPKEVAYKPVLIESMDQIKETVVA